MNKTKEGSMRVVFVEGGENMCDVKGVFMVALLRCEHAFLFNY